MLEHQMHLRVQACRACAATIACPFKKLTYAGADLSRKGTAQLGLRQTPMTSIMKDRDGRPVSNIWNKGNTDTHKHDSIATLKSRTMCVNQT